MRTDLLEGFKHSEMIFRLLSDDKTRRKYQDETGFTLGNLTGQSLVEKHPDETPDNEKEIFYRFVVWATDNYWDKSSDANNIIVYKNAKAFLSTH